MPAHDAIHGEILRLAGRDLDRYDFAREAARVLRRAVPFDAMAGVLFDRRPGCRSTNGSTTPSPAARVPACRRSGSTRPTSLRSGSWPHRADRRPA
jgi:hypothetical protein